MPQGLGRNLYPTLSVEENLQFFARLFGHDAAERRRRIDALTRATGLQAFLQRPAGQLSGGMKQKLGLCCALIHDPDLLVLDEPTTGVDPLARAQFWQLIAGIRVQRPGMSVIVATAYMDEARRFDHLVALDAGRVLAEGSPAGLLQRTGAADLEAAFIALLPEARRAGHQAFDIPPLRHDGEEDCAIEADGLTMRFGDFVAVDNVSFRIARGEIFGFLGSNGCGKTTTMKMLTGLLPASEGHAWLFGQPVDPKAIDTRRRVGYMSQGFSLYAELTVRQNLLLHARLFGVAPAQVARHIEFLAATLPSLAQDFESGAKRMAVYAKILGEFSDNALAYMSREAIRRLDWFPTPHQCLQILAEYRETTQREQALRLVHNWASSKFHAWIDGIRADAVSQADIDGAPDQWKRVAAERCILRRMDDGSYTVRRKALA